MKYDGGCLEQEKITFHHRNIVNVYIVYEKEFWPNDLGTDFKLENTILGVLSRLRILILIRILMLGMILDLIHMNFFLLSHGSGFCENVIMFGVDNSTSVHVDNRKKSILVLCKSLKDKLDGSKIKADAEYFYFSEQRKIIFLILHCNWSNSFLFVNVVEIYQFKAEGSQI